MSLEIPESDWKHFKNMRAILLERFCERALSDLATLAQSPKGSAHDRYLRAYKLIHERDKKLATAFNDFRRSTAIMQLGIMRQMKLLTDEELSIFSDPTQNYIRAIESL